MSFKALQDVDGVLTYFFFLNFLQTDLIGMMKFSYYFLIKFAHLFDIYQCEIEMGNRQFLYDVALNLPKLSRDKYSNTNS